MNNEYISKLVAEKIEAARKSSDTPKKFLITENGRGVVDGGDLYNAVLKEALSIMQVALVDILKETVNKSDSVAKTK